MAKKFIQVVYKVDSAEMERTKKTISDTEKEANKADRAFKKLNQSATRGGKEVSITYVDLRAKMLYLRDAIEMTALSDKKRLEALKKQYQEAKKEVDNFNASFQKGTQNNIFGLNNLGSTIKTVLTIGLIKEAGEAVLELTALAGKVEGVKRAFDRLPNSVLLMEELKQRTHGALTEFELMQKALQARNFGIPIENLGKLLEFAAIKSQQTGISIQYLTDSIVTGLGRESIKILDNLQIDIGLLKQRMQETGLSMREVVGDIVNEELKKMGGYIATGETSVNRLNSAFQELKITLSGKIEQSSFIEEVTQFLNDVRTTINAGGIGGFLDEREREETQKQAIANIEEFRIKNKDLLKDRTQGIKVVMAEIAALKEQVVVRKTDIAILKAERDAMKANFPEPLSAVQARKDLATEQIRVFENRNELARAQVPLLMSLLRQVSGVDEKEKDNTVTIKDLNDKIKDYNEQIEESTSIHDQAKIKSLQNLRDQTIAYRDALVNLNQVAKTSDSDPVFELTGDLTPESFDYNKALKEDTKRTWDEINRINDQGLKDRSDADVSARKKREQDEADEMDRREQLLRAFGNLTENLVMSSVMLKMDKEQRMEDEAYEKEQKRFDQRIKLAGNNKRAIQAIEEERLKFEEEASKKQAKRNQERMIKEMTIQGLLNAVRALGTPPVPNFALAGLTALFTGIQVGIAKSIGYKEGVIDLQGPGTGTSDSIPARLSKGESVITASATAGSKNLLEAINDHRINDSILNKLQVSAGGITVVNDNKGIEKVLQKYRPDFYTQGHLTYERKRKAETLIQHVRQKHHG